MRSVCVVTVQAHYAVLVLGSECGFRFDFKVHNLIYFRFVLVTVLV